MFLFILQFELVVFLLEKDKTLYIYLVGSSIGQGGYCAFIGVTIEVFILF